MLICPKIYNFAPLKTITMSLYTEKAKLQNFLSNQNQNNVKIGLVPTMGALHAGHLSLIQRATQENKIVVVSIFVNPTQFNNPEDLEKYPRTLEEDIAKINTVSNGIIVYAPSTADIYSDAISSDTFDFDGLEHEMEGKHRAGHFDGVGTIVKKLFEIITPTNAYFGEKDFQQLQIVKKMVEKEKLPVTIVGCPILREPNGLAMSSRNERLSTTIRQNAAVIFETLTEAKSIFEQKDVTATKNWIENIFDNTAGFELEYIEIADEETLKPVTKKEPLKKQRAFIAVYTEGVRLIDNIALN